MVDYVGKVKQLIASHQFLQFTANWCPDCIYANSIWKRFGVQSKIHMFEVGPMSNNEREQYRKAFQEVTGSRNLPTVVVNGKFWATESELHRFEAKGTLKEELQKIGLL
ncbi:glutathione-disulfide reductase GRX8 TDEL_0E01630 [Torulaspora delbrueckii]|uniref:Glutaredoxin domain-containing protein n=1 Tax=Torulaspora delbrueckii TaxID=4950 RepID=G8ZUW2_TORDE|nr:hypothetical protein TDEL_0E01630 [Torulaspora delbrueckii]CCE92406.1 hypothetical protein TDEL_0E01630 [Torulaspora delbrueckii]